MSSDEIISKPESPPLRIAQLNSMLTGGGTDDQCVKLAHGLHELRQKVWLVGPDVREMSGTVRQLQIPYHPTPPEGPLKLRFILGAAKLIRRERIQIVHGHHGRDLWPTILAARLSGVRPKVVLTRHLAKSPSSWFSRRLLLGQCDAMFACSRFVARVLSYGAYEPNSPEPERRSRPPLMGDHSKIEVVYGGIDTERFRPLPTDDGSVLRLRREWGLAPEHFAFSVVGGYALPRGKGQREFLQAAAQVHERLPNARFLIVGRGNLKDILETDIQKLGLNGKAWLTPYCRDMPAAMNAIDCLVHPQIGTEAFPGVVLEAFACGKPVIASSLDGIPEAFEAGNYGQLVTPENVAELASALTKWAGAKPLGTQERGDLHLRLRARFSLAVSAENHLFSYGQILL